MTTYVISLTATKRMITSYTTLIVARL